MEIITNTEKSIANSWLKFLKERFETKIEPKKYYLSYSGGKDSHFLYWFIKEYIHWEGIEIVGVNTSFEIPEIRDRILRNSDIVLHPLMNRWDIKEKYGIPCFSKQQDEYIYRYQNGSRSDNTMRAINGENAVFNLNKNVRELLLSGKLHKCSNKCCYWNKDRAMELHAKETGRKAIMGVRGSESQTRKAKYNTCLKKNGDFSPLYDVSDSLMELFYWCYDIEIPNVYQYVNRTGCAGCPYGRNISEELRLLPELQRKSAIKFFKESYDVKGINYKDFQISLFDFPEIQP